MSETKAAGVHQHKLDVLRTKEYQLFSHLEGNRTLNTAHVNKLIESMSEVQLVSPIIVNHKYQIIDGQHRFEACKELNLPVLYIMVKNYGLEEVQRFNSNQKNFSYEDFVNGYIDLGNNDYLVLRQFRDRFKFDWGTCIAMLSGKVSRGGEAGSAAFKNGQFKVKDLEKASINAEKLEELGRFYPNYRKRYFLLAATKMMQTSGYDHRQMIDKLRYLSTKLVDCSSSEDYLKLLETIYNYKSRSQTLRFL